MFSRLFKQTFLASVAYASVVHAGFNTAAETNLAVYWGQNSAGGGNSQDRLVTYCANSAINIIPLAFLYGINAPTTNFASASNICQLFTGTSLHDCPQIADDIKTCQTQYNKTILLSIGGATYTEGGFATPLAAQTAAEKVWALFGPQTTSSTRPFGSSVVDGFDLDLESVNTNMVPFAQRLRDLMDADKSKKYYLSAAPQCPFPDLADNAMLDRAIAFDFVMVQFYNNYCGVQSFTPGAGAGTGAAGSAAQGQFNFATWDNWAKTASRNPDVKILLGVPANVGAGNGYQPATALASIIQYSKQFSSFGGVMMWDMSQLWANTGYLAAVQSALGSPAPAVPTSGGGATAAPVGNTAQPTTTTTCISTFSTAIRQAASDSISASSSSALTTTATPAEPVTSPKQTTLPAPPSSSVTGASTPVKQWGQCGGNGYAGSTECEAPFECRSWSIWWSHCF